MPKLLRTISEVSDFTSLYHLVNRRIGLIPTMGALHEGHLELGRKARKECDCVIYSIFVNPIQFGKGEDLERYPRDMKGDMEKLDSVGADAVFAPETAIMYGKDHSTFVDTGRIGRILCGRTRKNHFRGVATVVLKLFNITGCDQAYFGKKDYQQFVILKKMVRELDLPHEIIGIDTIRDPDGLAMSSRNSYLSDSQRKSAVSIYRALSKAKGNLLKYKDKSDLIRDTRSVIEKEKSAEIEYLEIRNADDLSKIKSLKTGKKFVLMTAVKIGGTRLIDNIELN